MVTQAELDLYLWQETSNDNFTSKLYTLIAKADNANRAKLALGFPEEVEAMTRFQKEEGYWEDLKKRIKKG